MKNFLLGIGAALLIIAGLGADGGARGVTVNGQPVFNIKTGPGLATICNDGECVIGVVPQQVKKSAMVQAPDTAVQYK